MWFLVLSLLAATSPKRLHFEVAGSAPSIAFDSRGVLHVVYVDDRGVVHRDLSSNQSVVISPKGSRPDARGEVGPVITPNLVVIYSNRTDAKWSSSLLAQRSLDNGRTWSEPMQINDDAKPASHSFTDAVMNRTGDVVVSWLDSRGGHQGVQTAVLRNTRASTNGSVDAMTCECCRTALLTTSDGNVWLAYRDHSEGNIRNMAYAVSRDGGMSFSKPRTIADDRWSVNGCPESGPRLTQTPDGNVWAVWFNGRLPAIELSSFRGGAFVAPHVIAAPAAAISMVNHPDIGVLPDGRLVILYEAIRKDGTTAIMARVADRPAVVVARNAASPRYARSGDRAAIAYTTLRNGNQFVTVVDWRDAIRGTS